MITPLLLLSASLLSAQTYTYPPVVPQPAPPARVRAMSIAGDSAAVVAEDGGVYWITPQDLEGTGYRFTPYYFQCPGCRGRMDNPSDYGYLDFDGCEYWTKEAFEQVQKAVSAVAAKGKRSAAEELSDAFRATDAILRMRISALDMEIRSLAMGNYPMDLAVRLGRLEDARRKLAKSQQAFTDSQSSTVGDRRHAEAVVEAWTAVGAARSAVDNDKPE